ncbi:MAG: hypothetical protein IT368_07595 [Candidatus Hydrogenedentes bacterium]|nr:hypothetical protein [Candidatus Hydrogenedentota bacterium]
MSKESTPAKKATPAGLDRRNLLKGALGLGILGAASGAADTPAPPLVNQTSAGMIARENARPGTTDWMLTKTFIAPETRYRSPRIEGYCSATSVAAGDRLDIMVSTNPPAPFDLKLYRMGFYGGTGARLVHASAAIEGQTQPDPPVGDMRLRDCQWATSLSLTISEDWISGVYVGKLTEHRDGLQSYVIFIVRDNRQADFIFQCSDTTWNAYNRWPDQYALYDDGKNEWHLGPNTATSFNRPYGKYCQVVDTPLSIGSGEFMLWEFPMVFWLEQQGYDVTYISNLDTHADGPGLLRARGFLSVGHDESWTLEMYNNVYGAIQKGLSAGFFSGDTCWGMIRLLPDQTSGRPRHITRVDHFGPTDEVLVEHYPAVGEFPHQGPDQALMIGGRDVYPVSGGAAWICSAEDHWIFEGTGMKNGDAIPGLVGFEWHGAPADIPGLRVVATGTASTGGSEGTYASTVYPGPKGNVVFNASTIWWADGLAEPPGYVRPATYTQPQGPDARVQRITRNLLDRMRA